MAVTIPTLTKFRNEFPELSQVSDTIVNSALKAAYDLHNETVRGVLLCAAHFCVSDDLVEVLSSAQGPVSSSFQAYDRGTFWATSSYGRLFREYESRLSPKLFSV